MARRQTGEATARDPRATFFPKKRVRLELASWTPKRSSEGEKRVRLNFMLPLIDKTRDGVLPAWLISALATMEEPDSAETEIALNTVLEGVTTEFYDVDKSKERTSFFSAATFSGFTLKRVTRDGNTFPALCFNTNIRRSNTVLRWCDRYECMYLWAAFTPADPATPTRDVPGAQMNIADAAKGGKAEPDGDDEAGEDFEEQEESEVEG